MKNIIFPLGLLLLAGYEIHDGGISVNSVCFATQPLSAGSVKKAICKGAGKREFTERIIKLNRIQCKMRITNTINLLLN